MSAVFLNAEGAEVKNAEDKGDFSFSLRVLCELCVPFRTKSKMNSRHDVFGDVTSNVGQSEIAVAGLTDMFMLLLAPGAGDDLQGIKKGIVELADLIVVNKADGDLAPAAERARRDYAAALHLLRSPLGGWQPTVMTCSSLEGAGINEVWAKVSAFRDQVNASGSFTERRAAQANQWMWDEVNEVLQSRLRENTEIRDTVDAIEASVANGTTSVADAARAIIQQLDET